MIFGNCLIFFMDKCFIFIFFKSLNFTTNFVTDSLLFFSRTCFLLSTFTSLKSIEKTHIFFKDLISFSKCLIFIFFSKSLNFNFNFDSKSLIEETFFDSFAFFSLLHFFVVSKISPYFRFIILKVFFKLPFILEIS